MFRSVLSAVTIVFFAIPASFAQTTKRTISPVGNYPVADRISKPGGNSVPTDLRAISIVAVSVNGKKVPVGKAFEASKAWLDGLTIELENISPLPIKSVRISFSLPETKAIGMPTGFSLEYGKDLSTTFEKNETPLIAPGQKIKISRSESHYKRDNQGIEKRTGLSDFSEVTLVSATVKFANDDVWSSFRLPFGDIDGKATNVVASRTNLVTEGSRGISNWRKSGDAFVETISNVAALSVKNKAQFSQDIGLPGNSKGKFALLVSRCSSERVEKNSITGLPYIYGRWISGGQMIDEPLQGQRMLCELGEVNKWATNWGIFKIPGSATAIKVDLNQAEGKGFPQNGSVARFANVGLYIFDSESEAMDFVNAFDDSYRAKHYLEMQTSVIGRSTVNK